MLLHITMHQSARLKVITSEGRGTGTWRCTRSQVLNPGQLCVCAHMLPGCATVLSNMVAYAFYVRERSLPSVSEPLMA
jgi:hypothetical protein